LLLTQAQRARRGARDCVVVFVLAAAVSVTHTDYDVKFSMTADDTKSALSYAWDLVNARKEVSVKISDIHVATFLCVNAGIWFGSSLFFYPAEVVKIRQQVDRTPVNGRSVVADSSSHVRGMVSRHE
jgi:hypothetical protein